MADVDASRVRAPAPSPAGGPVMVPPGEPPAGSSRPDQELDHRYNIYEHHPVPWWVAMVWLGFFCFGAFYLIVNLVR